MKTTTIFLLLTIFCANTQAAPGSIRLSAGLAASEGDYGTTEETALIALPYSIRYQKQRLGLAFSQSWMKITGPTNIPADSSTDDSLTSSREGFSDPVVSLSYRPQWQLLKQVKYSLASKIKIPTSDAKENLGTGEKDYSLQINTYSRIHKSLLVLQLGYQWMGDSSTKDYNNRFYSALNFQQILGTQVNVGGRLYFKQKSSSTSKDVLSLGANASYKISKAWKVSTSITKGLSDSAADLAISSQLSYKISN